MSELTFLLLRLGFIAVLWIFIFSIVYALRSDLFGAPARRMRDRGKNSAPAVEVLTAAGGGFNPAQTAPVFSPAQPQQSNSVAGSAPDVTELPSAGKSSPARTLLITSGVANGTEIALDEGAITIGRSPDSTLVIVDEYTSTHHARLTRVEHGWTLTDLDSTNGTKLDGKRIQGTVELPIFVPVTIGTTTFELRP